MGTLIFQFLKRDYIQMKMFGLILFLVKRLGTSTHKMNYRYVKSQKSQVIISTFF